MSNSTIEVFERLWLHITSRLHNKVDKVEGKGLSSNDFTNEDKQALENISQIQIITWEVDD